MACKEGSAKKAADPIYDCQQCHLGMWVGKNCTDKLRCSQVYVWSGGDQTCLLPVCVLN